MILKVRGISARDGFSSVALLDYVKSVKERDICPEVKDGAGNIIGKIIDAENVPESANDCAHVELTLNIFDARTLEEITNG